MSGWRDRSYRIVSYRHDVVLFLLQLGLFLLQGRYSLLRHLQVGLQLHILPVCACVRVCVCVTGCPKKVAMVCLGDFRIGRGIGWGRLGTILMGR